jgi:hypothetical protein
MPTFLKGERMGRQNMSVKKRKRKNAYQKRRKAKLKETIATAKKK